MSHGDRPSRQLVHPFPTNTSNEIFSRLKPHFQIPNDVPIRKSDIGEKCYDGRLSDEKSYDFPRPRHPLPLPLLVKDRDYVVDTTRSIIQDADPNECSKHKTEASIKRLKDCLESEAENLKKFKDSSRIFG
nr:hypothetical protein CFP56_28054 [Quercus suber]